MIIIHARHNWTSAMAQRHAVHGIVKTKGAMHAGSDGRVWAREGAKVRLLPWLFAVELSLQWDWSCVVNGRKGFRGFLDNGWRFRRRSHQPLGTGNFSMMRRDIRLKRAWFELDPFYLTFWNTEGKLKFSAGFGTATESFDFSKAPPLTAWSEDGNILSDDAITADRCAELVKRMKSKKRVSSIFPVKQSYRR